MTLQMSDIKFILFNKILRHDVTSSHPHDLNNVKIKFPNLMKFSLLPISEIENFKRNEQIIRDTAKQVIKDFATFGMEISFPGDISFAYDSLFSQLKIIIAELLRREPEKLSALLYQIDLDENSLKSEPEVFTEHEFISSMILEREFLKVLTRYYFKNNPGKI